MTSDQLRTAIQESERAFEFLESEFGYRRSEPRLQSGGFRLRYTGDVLGVQVDWYPRDPFTVWLVRLQNGDFPPQAVPAATKDRPRYFDMEDLEQINGHRREITGLKLYALPDRETTDLLAGNLRRYGARLLRGDLSELGPLEQRVLGRMRAIAIDRYGRDGTHRPGQ